MSDKHSTPAKLIQLRPRPDHLLRVIRNLAVAGRISYLDHALLERMPERGFDVFDVEHVLKTGMIDGPIDPGAKAGEWKVKIVSWLNGTNRKMGVLVIVVRETCLLIKTTEWEDR